MNTEIEEKLRKLISRYPDASVYSTQQWLDRKETVGRGAVVTLVAEGPLNHILNGYVPAGPRDLTLDKLEKLAEEHGLFVEQGYGWSWHLYR